MTNLEGFGLACFVAGVCLGLILALVAAYLSATVDLLREERLAHHERKCGGCR